MARSHVGNQHLALMAWLSTSACQTGSQNITLEAEVKLLQERHVNATVATQVGPREHSQATSAMS